MRSRLLAVCCLGSLFGCASLLPPEPKENPLLATGHPYSPAEWTTSRTRATEAVAPQLAEGFTVVGATLDVRGTGTVQHELRVPEAGCYAVGLGWATSEAIRAQVVFPGAAGTRVSDVTGGTIAHKLAGGSGVVPFCVDRAGTALLSAIALDVDSGAMLGRFEVQLAVAAVHTAESADARAARHAAEEQGVARTAAQEEANIADAQATEAQRKAACVLERDKCVSGLPHRRPVSAKKTDTCEQVMQLCLAGLP